MLDHCHTTGRLRGFLCHGCNAAIGLAGENAEALLFAARYVSRECNQRQIAVVT